MKRKSSVRFGGISAELVLASLIVSRYFESRGEEFVWTSVIDGKHGSLSYHRSGFAMDVRLPKFLDLELCATELRVLLGPEFDVVVESDHLHIEFDVRRQGVVQ